MYNRRFEGMDHLLIQIHSVKSLPSESRIESDQLEGKNLSIFCHFILSIMASLFCFSLAIIYFIK